MSLWGSLTSGIKPKYYSNTAEVFSVNVATEQSNHQLAHAGWVIEKAESVVLSIAVANAGLGYLVGDHLTFTGGLPATGYPTANVTVATVNANGGITGLTVTVAPHYANTTVPTIGVSSANGTAAGATFTGTLPTSGRLGRTRTEVLVAGSFDDTTFGVG